MKTLRELLLFPLLLLLFIVPALAESTATTLPVPAQDDGIIVPGERVGWMKIGMDYGIIDKTYARLPCRRSISGRTTIYAYDTLRFYVNEENKVVTIVTRDPRYALAGSITVGAQANQVVQALGPGISRGQYISYDSGLRIRIFNDAVFEIAVYAAPKSRRRAGTGESAGGEAGTGSGESPGGRAGLGRTEIPLKQSGGVFVLPVLINEVITFDFVLDSGAADVRISSEAAEELTRAGTLKEGDFLPGQVYRLADGSKVKSQRFVIRTLRLGNITIRNVLGSIGGEKSQFLLGESLLKRLGSWTIDNRRRVLIISPPEPSRADRSGNPGRVPAGKPSPPADAGPVGTSTGTAKGVTLVHFTSDG